MKKKYLMDKVEIDIAPYTELIRKLNKINKAMRYAKDEISEEPLMQLCEDPDYRALAIERIGYRQIDDLERIGEGNNRAEELHKWSKDMDRRLNRDVVLDTCMGSTRSVMAMHFVYAFSGDLRITTDHDSFILKEGQTGVFDIGVPHGVLSADDAEEEAIPISCLLFKSYLTEMIGSKSHAHPLFNEFLSRAFYPGDNYRGYLLFDTSGDNMLRYLFIRALHEYTYHRPFSLDSVDTCIMDIIISLMREYSLVFNESSTYRPLTEKIKQVLDYIDANLCDVTLASAAQAFHFSPNHLSRWVKEQTGDTFLELVHKARLREATYYLRMQDLTVTQVANMVGYNNISYFYKIFQQKFNVSPNEYRKSFGLFSEKYRTKLLEEE